jgi:hypothetical protein
MGRVQRDESGFALITAVLILAVLTMLMTLVIANGTSVNNIAERGNRWTRVLGAAESGIDAAIATLSVNRAASGVVGSDGVHNCATGTAYTCTTSFGQYQVSWSTSGITTTVDSVGYYPSKAAANAVSRHVRVLFQPPRTFIYAMYSSTTLNLGGSSNTNVIGDIFAAGGITTQNLIQICGSLTSSGSGVTLGNGAAVRKSLTYTDPFTGTTRVCTGATGNVWTAGNISLGLGALVEGYAKASGTSPCAFSITGGAVQGDATTCGPTITSTVSPGTKYTNANTATPTDPGFPAFTWYAANYPGLVCLPSSGDCGPTNTSATAVTSFNTAHPGGENLQQGNYAVWQTGADCHNTATAPPLDLGNLAGTTGITGDLTIVTNWRIDFGNTSFVKAAANSANVTIISTCPMPTPSSGYVCTDLDQSGCSIFGKNKVTFDPKTADPTDGLAALLYTPGWVSFKNTGNQGDGALYAGAIDAKNGYSVTYNDRISQVLGFGAGDLVPTLWQEINT